MQYQPSLPQNLSGSMSKTGNLLGDVGRAVKIAITTKNRFESFWWGVSGLLTVMSMGGFSALLLRTVEPTLQTAIVLDKFGFQVYPPVDSRSFFFTYGAELCHDWETQLLRSNKEVAPRSQPLKFEYR